jgi:hypothetical protein
VFFRDNSESASREGETGSIVGPRVNSQRAAAVAETSIQSLNQTGMVARKLLSVQAEARKRMDEIPFPHNKS